MGPASDVLTFEVGGSDDPQGCAVRNAVLDERSEVIDSATAVAVAGTSDGTATRSQQRAGTPVPP
jgi:hypothetical protein